MIAGTYRSKETNIRAIHGGTANNVVCPFCTIVVDRASFSKKKLEDELKNHDLDFHIEEKEDVVEITVNGTAAHASTPQLGVNAISYLFRALQLSGFQDQFLEFYT